MSKLTMALQRYLLSNRDRQYASMIETNARVGVGHIDGHMRTRDWLLLQSDFAQAKDAVSVNLDVPNIESLIKDHSYQSLTLHSQAINTMEFLLRPDLGRILHVNSADVLSAQKEKDSDVLIVISGGLSAHAVNKQVPGFLPIFLRQLHGSRLTVAPIVINPRGRVALGDDINQYLQAKVTIMLIGERPGLGSSESMGIYFTYNARKGCTDEGRNCISNVHQNGLSSILAAEKLHYMITKSIKMQLSGVELKDDQSQYLTHL